MTEEGEPQGSGCAGVLVALAVAGTVGTVAWAAAPAVLVLVIWSAGALALWWAVSRPLAKIDSSAPPDPGCLEEIPEIQVREVGGAGTVVYHRDSTRRYIVDRDTAPDAGGARRFLAQGEGP